MPEASSDWTPVMVLIFALSGLMCRVHVVVVRMHFARNLFLVLTLPDPREDKCLTEIPDLNGSARSAG